MQTFNLWKIKKRFMVLLWMAASFYLTAQKVSVAYLTIADGLSQGMIYDILQDRDGFMWVATKDGLNQYDGYRFEVFTNDPFNPFSIAGNDINRLFEDSRGNLWVSVFGKGLDMLERNSNRFYHLPLNTIKDVAASTPYVAEAPDGTIWVGTPDGLLRLRWKEKPAWDNPDLKASMSVEVASIGHEPSKTQFNNSLILADGSMLVSISTGGVYKFDPANALLTLLLPTPKSVDIPHFLETAPGRVWIKLDKKVFLMEGGGPLREVAFAKPTDDYRITRLVSDGHGNLFWCYSSFIKGSYFYSAPESEVLRSGSAADAEMVYNCQPYSPWFELDKSGNLWVGTNGYGLHKIHLLRQPFQHFLPGISILSIMVADRIYFTNFMKGGCFMFDDASNTIIPAPQFPAESLVFTLSQARKDGARYFTGIYPGDQYFLGTMRGTHTVYRDIPPVNQYSPLREDSKGRFWAGAEDSRLMCVLPDGERIIYFGLPKKLGEGVRVQDLLFDQAQNFWVGTTNGILKINMEHLEASLSSADGQVQPDLTITGYQIYQTEPNNPHSLRHNFVTSFCEDPSEPGRFLWVSTKGGGLNLLDKATDEFRHFISQNSGLPNDVVYGILPDEQGNIWGSTNRGLFRLAVEGQTATCLPSTVKFRNFREFDGLQSDEFNSGIFARLPGGKLLFGGVNGITIFDPAAIIDRTSDAIVLITGLKINNAPFAPEKEDASLLQRPIHRMEQIRLDHTQRILTLEFALMDFVNAQENRFRYRLRGVDPGWVEAGTNHSANYANLRPGSYEFEVQGSISGGQWSAPAMLKITVLPPFWATWWAYTLYALAFGTAVFSFYKIRLRQKLQHQEALRLRELDEFKSRFFTNISHEFRTPLTVVLGNLEIMKMEIEKLGSHLPIYQFLISKISMIRRNAESLLLFINQILDLAKLETNSLKINFVQGDVLPYLRYISESLHSLANAQNVMLKVESNESQIIMDFDPERLLQIVYNLLSNAIKFTPSGGWVVLRADFGNLKDLRNLVLTVNDTGVGIPPEDLSKVFDRFYQASNSTLGSQGANSISGGTGIGLSLTKELVKAVGGDISVESEVNKGTTFKVRLPISNKAAASEGVTQSHAVPMVLPEAPAISTFADNFPAIQQSNNLLIIEDNPDVVEYLATCLGTNYQLDFAYNGRAGIEKALETVPDLIISDVMMPEKDGFEVCDFLKNDERTSHIPVILLTAKADMESRIAGLKRGADAYLAKPFYREELLVTLQNLLELRRKLQAKYAVAALVAEPVAANEPATEVAVTSVDLENEFLKKLRLHIEEHLGDTAFDGARLAKAMNLSEVQLYRKIKALTDKSTAIYIRSIRLAKGRELLQTTKMNVSEIAYEVGFDDPNYFSRTFSQEFGMSPSDVRK